MTIEQWHLCEKKASDVLVTVRPKQLDSFGGQGGMILALNVGQASPRLCFVPWVLVPPQAL